jgi:metal-responsive CopG/Arc/MetJ family transcriptional regulator
MYPDNMRPVTEGENVTLMSVSVTKKMKSWLDASAKKHKVPRSAIVRAALRAFAQRQDEAKWKECQ